MNNAVVTYIGKCPRCKKAVATDVDTARVASYQVRSGCCNRWTVVSAVLGAVTQKECGAHCEDATSHSCKCECGGSRHGITWRIASAA